MRKFDIEALLPTGSLRDTARFMGYLEAIDNWDKVNVSGNKSITAEHVRLILESGTRLRLNVAGCVKIEDGVFDVNPSEKSLKKLNLSGCVRLTSKSITHLESFSQLEELNIQGCHKITDSVLEMIKEARRNKTGFLSLKTLYVDSPEKTVGLSSPLVAGIRGLEVIYSRAPREENSLRRLNFPFVPSRLYRNLNEQFAEESEEIAAG